ncbi:LPXTG cell wall anchor domain-containing protein [Jiangella mangrovi]|uniref:LPXTG-motif cell wall-anchored protein n=1 Tax=Jiangella mangrovi TaxID=1524084 RepID=A0A7W9GXR7_9ACTN|nr:LPXTG cell wall anchor domain-containing protein [Jiangella mangrovi]MBB5791586.1 LPXTG-motif cell wall-anchored protein [Jiangella mangrovi]
MLMIALPSGALMWAVPTAYVAEIRRGATLRKVTIAILAGLALLFGGAMPAWAEATTEAKTAADCAAYVDSEDWCDPGSELNYNCDPAHIPEQYWPVQLVDVENDPFDLDGNDNNGWGCGDAPVEEPPAEEPPVEEPPAESSGSCEAYVGSEAWCADGVDDYDCPQIDNAHKPILLVDAQDDPFHLDDDVDGVGCEVDTEGDEDPSNNGGTGDDDAGTGGDGEALPNTGSGDLGPLWLAVLAFLAAGALLVTRRVVSQR